MMVCSVFADQPWWGEKVSRLGVGARASALGEAIRAEGDGLPEATEIFEDWLQAPAGR